MQYMGSKARIVKQILPQMLRERQPDQTWVEPFVGSGSVIMNVEGKRIGNDLCRPIVSLLEAVANGWCPPETISAEEYKAIKNSQDSYPSELVGFVMFGCSFGGKGWGGYARNNSGANYAAMARKALLRDAPKLKGIVWKSESYLDLNIPERSLIYCDPPYASTTGYTLSFDHRRFWNWCREKSNEGHTVFISEYSAPADFECVLEISHSTTLNKNVRNSRTEKLFRRYPDSELW